MLLAVRPVASTSGVAVPCVLERRSNTHGNTPARAFKSHLHATAE